MGHPIAYIDRSRLQAALIACLDRSIPAFPKIEYRLVGTAAALLQGVDLPTADIDILVKTRRDVEAFGATLATFRCLQAPAWLTETQQYYGNYEVDGIEVGISTVEIQSDTDTIETFGRGPWEHFALVPLGRHNVPTVALELRLITELYRDRPDRYEPLLLFMQTHGCDVDLVRRGLAATGLSQPVQDNILSQLSGAASNVPSASFQH